MAEAPARRAPGRRAGRRPPRPDRGAASTPQGWWPRWLPARLRRLARGLVRPPVGAEHRRVGRRRGGRFRGCERVRLRVRFALPSLSSASAASASLARRSSSTSSRSTSSTRRTRPLAVASGRSGQPIRVTVRSSAHWLVTSSTATWRALLRHRRRPVDVQDTCAFQVEQHLRPARVDADRGQRRVRRGHPVQGVSPG